MDNAEVNYSHMRNPKVNLSLAPVQELAANLTNPRLMDGNTGFNDDYVWEILFHALMSQYLQR